MIRTLLALGLSALMAIASAGKTPASGPVHVSGYTTKNGTVVQPYYRRAPGSGSTYTAPTARIYSSCADARAAGRWNILPSDSDWSPKLDRDNDGIACEAGSDGSSSGRDADPAGTVVTPGKSADTAVSSGPTYPEVLAEQGQWLSKSDACSNVADARRSGPLPENSGVTAYVRTYSYTNLGITPDQERRAIDDAPHVAVTVISPWSTADTGTGMTQRMTAAMDPEMYYVLDVSGQGLGSSLICISAYAMRR